MALTSPKEAMKAEALGIEMIFIPKGATERYQPLDKRPFGTLASKRKAKWRHEFAEHYVKVCTTEIGAELLLQSWDEAKFLVEDVQ
jgi:hypothetical protein